MVANPVGRPKLYSEEELKKIGKDLINWCRQDGNWHISGFEDDYDLSTEFCYEMSRYRPEEFSRTFKRAKAIIGRKMMALAMEKNGPSPWMQATLLPLYLEDIDTHLDSKRQKELIMIEKAKGLNEQTTSEKADSIIDAADKITEEKDDSSKL